MPLFLYANFSTRKIPTHDSSRKGKLSHETFRGRFTSAVVTHAGPRVVLMLMRSTLNRPSAVVYRLVV